MRIFLVLFSIVSFGFTPKNVFSQNTKVRIETSELITVNEVFDLIKEQTDYTFIYKSDLFENAPKVFLKKGVISAEKLLKKSLSFGKFSCVLSDDGVILLKKEDNLKPNPQQIIITGIVTNKDGEALPGVNIVEKGTNNGVVSDVSGKYEISVKAENSVLVFSFIGYQTKEVQVNNNKVINVVLSESFANLKEIVIISTGYQKISKEKATGAAENIKNSFYEDAYLPTLQEGFQGSIAGLQIITNNAHPQAVPQVIIRGVGSAFQEGVGAVAIGGSNSVLEDPISLTAGGPLYVIDGVPTTDGKDLSSISGNDIKSITVLKDASAASIYGARGANGVIVVETKSGISGKTRIDFSSQIGFSDFTDLNRRLNTSELQELYIEGLINNTTNGIDTEQDALNFLLNPGGSTTPFNPNQNTNWADELTRTSLMSQNNISISGGNNDNRYYISAGYLKNETPIKEIDFERFSVRLKYDTKILERLTFSTNLSYSNVNSDNYETGTSFFSPFRNMYLLRPDFKVYNDDGTYDYSYNYRVNPLAVLTEETRKLKTNDFRSFANLKYEVFEGLTIEPSLSASYKLVDNFNNFPADIGKGYFNGSAYAIQKNTNTFIWDAKVLFRYMTTFGKDHSINAFAGFENTATDIQILNVSVENMRPGTTTLDNGDPIDAYTKRLKTALSSFFINTDYSYKDKYFINVLFRRDGSSKFGQENRYGNFYSVGLGWNMKNEDFLKDIDFINFLKIRTSYGVNGNDQIGSFNYVGTYDGTAFYNNSNAVTIASAGNPALGWEENANFDIGVDFTMFNNRVSGSIDYYSRNTDKLLYNLGISAYNGDNFVFQNFGGMNNKGIEISLNTRNIISNNNNFIWTSGFNFTSNKNKVTKLDNDEIISGIHIRKVGEDFNTLYLYGYAGVDPQTGEELYYTDETETATTPNRSEAEKYSQGKTSPDFYGSFINTFTYKNLSLAVQFYTSWGGQIFETTGYIQNDNGYQRLRDYSNTSYYVYQHRWQNPGDITDVPKYVYGNSLSEIRSTRWLHDGSYIRLKKIELSYSLSNKLLDKTFIDRLRIFVSGTNLWTYVKDESLSNDPEIGGITGYASFDTPPTKTIYFGINISF
ncbi:MAG: SusC/RagA family TonB-linked outer membrane protein [Bacteroidales bacterium]|nr:SusC/RagA family TonB-linked outer membrane protein [Bacteroidales bacterium]